MQDVAVGQLVVNDVVAPFKANSTTEPEVNPLPLTVKLVMLVAPSLAENGEMEAMLNAPAPLRSRSQTPRPCVAARSVREALCNVKPRICALGRDDAAPKGDQLTPPSVVKKPPMSVPTYRVLWVASLGSITMAFTGMSGSFVAVPLMSTHVVAAPAVPLMVLKT